MPRKLSLRGFLRQDILSKRNKSLLPRHGSRASSPKREQGATFPLDSQFHSSSTPNENSQRELVREADSIFGEPIVAKDQTLQQKLEQFLAVDRKDSGSNVKQPQNPALDALKEELNVLVNLEIEANPEERELIRRQKSDLIREIGKLEAKDRDDRVKVRKGWTKSLTVSIATWDEVATLPEPIGLAEKKRLQLMKDRASKALLGLEGGRQKRKREDDNYLLDGEDRLRAGIKHKELQVTGRWFSRIHDYFPEPENGVDGAGVLEDLTIEEKMLMRRELAEYGEELAKRARKMKALENKGSV